MTAVQKPPVRVELFVLPTTGFLSGRARSSWLAYLSPGEHSRAADFRSAHDSATYLATHVLMRCMAAAALGVDPAKAAKIPVDRRCLLCTDGAQHGKPRIRGVNFSMSRSSGLVAGALAPGNCTDQSIPQLGTDVERIDGNLFEGFDRIALTEREAAVVAGLRQKRAQFARFMLWTAKEAVLKATGHGLSVEPQTVEVAADSLPKVVGKRADSSSTATLSLPGNSPQTFWVSWSIYGDFLVAVALDSPVHVKLQAVESPLDVKQLLSKPDSREKNERPN